MKTQDRIAWLLIGGVVALGGFLVVFGAFARQPELITSGFTPITGGAGIAIGYYFGQKAGEARALAARNQEKGKQRETLPKLQKGNTSREA